MNTFNKRLVKRVLNLLGFSNIPYPPRPRAQRTGRSKGGCRAGIRTGRIGREGKESDALAKLNMFSKFEPKPIINVLHGVTGRLSSLKALQLTQIDLRKGLLRL